MLEGLPEDPTRRGSLRIEIGGALYEYQVSITTSRDGAIVGTPSTWECECSNGELLERLRAELPTAAEGLVPEPEVEVVEEPEPVVEPPVVTGEDIPRRRLGPAGAAGVTLMVLGVTGVGAGGTLITLTNRPAPQAYATRQMRDFLWPGVLAAGTSAGLLAVGIVLYALRDRAGQRRRANITAFGPAEDGNGRFSLVVNGRF